MSEEIIEKIRFKLAIDRNEKLFIDKKILQELYESYLEEKEKNKELELENIKLQQGKGDIVNRVWENSKNYIEKEKVEIIRFNLNRLVDKILKEN